MKGITMVSSVLFLGFLIAATGIVYYAGVPSLQRIQCLATMEKMKSSFVNLDSLTRDVVSGGEGTKRTFNLNIDSGKMYIMGDNDTIYWEYECPVSVSSPRTAQTIGNVIFGENMEVSAYEGVCAGEDAYILENRHLKACFKKIGSPSGMVGYNNTEVLIYLYQKDLDRALPMEYLEVTVDNDQLSKSGTGYTSLERKGTNLPYGEVTAYMDSDYGIIYRIHFTLESGGDFLIIRGK